jgi:hypothetical protein
VKAIAVPVEAYPTLYVQPCGTGILLTTRDDGGHGQPDIAFHLTGKEVRSLKKAIKKALLSDSWDYSVNG